MTAEQSLYARAGLGGACAAASLIALNISRFRQGPPRTFDRYSTAALVLSRFGIFALIFLVFRIPPRGDIVAYYFPQALQALHGSIPYRDLLTSYAPLHPYLDAGAVLLWKSPLAIILLSICVEASLLPVWLKFGRVLFDEQHVRTATLLYVASPISLQFVAVDGQDNVIIALLLALGAFACYRNRNFVSGGLVSLSVVIVKFLPLLFAPVFFLAVPRRLRWVAGFVSVLVLGYGGFAAMRLPLLYPLRVESQTRTASNLPYLIESVFGLAAHPRVEDAVAFCALLGVLLLIAVRVRGLAARAYLRVLVFGPISVLLALLLFSKKSWPPYLVLVLFPLCLLFSSGARVKLRVGLFLLFSVVAVVVQSYWATILDESLAPDLHLMLAQGQHAAWLFLALQVLVIVGYFWLLGESIYQVAFAGQLGQAELPARAEAVSAGLRQQ